MRKLKPQTFICPYCHKEFTLSRNKLSGVAHDNHRHKFRGPYCSKSCASKGWHMKNPPEYKPIVLEYEQRENY